MEATVTADQAITATWWRSVAPAAIETELADLWQHAARDGPVSRALMSNLVIVRPHATMKAHAQEEPDSAIVQVARQHPARTILLNYSPVSDRTGQPAAASVGVLTFESGTTRYGVELIAVEASCADASIPSIVRRLTRGDVPTTVWWAADLSRIAPTAAMIATGRQLVYDSAMWRDVADGARAAAAIVGGHDRIDLADLNWRRLAPLRGALVHALAMDPVPQTIAAADVHIRYRPGEASAAWLLAAWFRCRLKWKSAAAPIVEETRQSDDLIELTLWSGADQLIAAMSRQRIKVKSGHAPVFRMPVPHETVVDAVVTELRSLGHDTCLTETVAALAALV
jgi:glucose-6-phosphate dehydrogenase assembly protein OpcA